MSMKHPAAMNDLIQEVGVPSDWNSHQDFLDQDFLVM